MKRNAEIGLFTKPSIFAFEWKKMMEAVTCRVAVRLSGRGDTAGDHLFGLVRVVRARFLGLLACQADGLVVEDRKDSSLRSSQGLAAALAVAGTGQFLFPMLFHPEPPLLSVPNLTDAQSVMTYNRTTVAGGMQGRRTGQPAPFSQAGFLLHQNPQHTDVMVWRSNKWPEYFGIDLLKQVGYD
jgi:hypothetical protein